MQQGRNLCFEWYDRIVLVSLNRKQSSEAVLWGFYGEMTSEANGEMGSKMACEMDCRASIVLHLGYR